MRAEAEAGQVRQTPTPGMGTLGLMIAAACLLLANLYYAQPILPEIAAAICLPRDASGAIVTASQLGYIAGLLFLAPLGDILENRKLCAAMAAGAGCAALAAAFAQAAPLYLGLAFLMGVFASATQVLVVFAVTLEGAGRSGKILGIMACGLFLGIAMSRPLSSFVTELANWRLSIWAQALPFLALPWRCGVATRGDSLAKSRGAMALF